ncbi:hypothetical protein UWK_03184 [Desulfocapsa sulfexigens DSM 10523]|uniref:Uncharacterized protein n=1 Tax=Desulfocapsa sulfexigens (strain DSM 10523 / SB164P1) TaxID=1167006 RepID=M1PTN2_DESSD|nr:hypothetical protein [Desulfocapsa sulfexigens]AGF79711.1 hypothetical protein UWK_03184 [Desulfocapsa sulfexigens DSM 10523]
MEELSKSQRARFAIRTFKTIADAMILRGYYRPSGRSGEKLSESLQLFEPEIYGSMNDHRIVELQGLEYVMDRMPRGVEKCNRIILTADEDFHDTSFEKVVPFKRRRHSYIVSDTEICFVITRGLTEIYDILTNLTFLNLEAQKIHRQICHKEEGTCSEWHELEGVVQGSEKLTGSALHQALWNLSIILGRTYREAYESYESFDSHHGKNGNYNNGLFAIIYAMGQRIIEEAKSRDNLLTIYFTPSLQEMIGRHKYATLWAKNIKQNLYNQGLSHRTIHVVSANMHSMKNIVYGAGFLKNQGKPVPEDLYDLITELRNIDYELTDYGSAYGFTYIHDTSESNIDVMVFDTSKISKENPHQSVQCDFDYIEKEKPVILVIDYAFGAQAFDILDELLCPCHFDDKNFSFKFESISIMGKAGTLPGKKGDIMLATAHVMEGTTNNYIVDNDLDKSDFDEGYPIHVGPMVTVLGTSMQNRHVLTRFHTSHWKAVGLEMEGGHYQRAISAAIIQGHVSRNIKTRYAYYASDNPLHAGETLASGSLGDYGIKPTYMITKVLLEKVINPPSPVVCEL